MKIKVTAEHIRRGLRGISFSCPISLALEDAGIEELFVGKTVLFSFNKKEIPLSKEAQKFVYDFDNNLPIKPFEFELKDEDLNFLKEK